MKEISCPKLIRCPFLLELAECRSEYCESNSSYSFKSVHVWATLLQMATVFSCSALQEKTKTKHLPRKLISIIMALEIKAIINNLFCCLLLINRFGKSGGFQFYHRLKYAYLNLTYKLYLLQIRRTAFATFLSSVYMDNIPLRSKCRTSEHFLQNPAKLVDINSASKV